ncbi:hypothetical protein BCV70DRAFT_121271 [Testicularia cyperi]|uniref:Tetratricopeptide repeat protein 1 n=1 Tax=Testicularia cyperi TaxID=1882483 RepID=A0A317XNS8_9BASI|nr:hypothetical protein BCV70DRAFT_121271 [Testicularia cyperi]
MAIIEALPDTPHDSEDGKSVIPPEAQRLKTEANAKYAVKDYDAALSIYLDILALLPTRPKPKPATEDVDEPDQDVDEDIGADSNPDTKCDDQAPRKATLSEQTTTEATETEPEELKKFRSAINANLAAVYLQQEQWKATVLACNESLLDVGVETNFKALHRRASANEKIGGWAGLSASLEDNKQLLSCTALPESQRRAVQNKITTLQPQVEAAANREKDEMMDKLKGLGNSILGTFGLSTDNFQFTQQPGGGYSMNFKR